MALEERGGMETHTDEELAALVRGEEPGALELLFERYKNLVKSRARSYFLVGADQEDLIQEGMIGLYKAIRDFNPQRTAGFALFADLCITHQILTAIRAANRQKHTPLNSYVSFNKPVFGGDSGATLADTLLPAGAAEQAANPEAMLVGREEYDAMQRRIATSLSKFEREVFLWQVRGADYREIARKLGRTPKAVDNALQRIRRKLGRAAAPAPQSGKVGRNRENPI